MPSLSGTDGAATVQTLEFDGHRLSYEIHGVGKRTLVFAHGLLLDSNLNRGLAEGLARKGHRVVLPDLLGHGRSDKPAHATEYRMDVYAEQMVAVIDDLGIDDAVVGGVSLGANVALTAAARFPERVRGLVLEMPVLEWAAPAAAMTFVPLLLGIHYARPVVRVLSGVARRLPRTGYGPADSYLNALSLAPESMAAVLHGLLVGPMAPTVEERNAITAPALILAHQADVIHPFSDATNLAGQLPNASLIRAHNPLELRLRPARLMNEIAMFLDDCWAVTHPASGAASGGAASGGAARGRAARGGETSGGAGRDGESSVPAAGR